MFVLSLIGIKIPITAFPSIILALYLIPKVAEFSDYQLLYIIVIVLSLMLDIMDILHLRD